MPLSLTLFFLSALVAAPHLRPNVALCISLAVALWAVFVGGLEAAFYG